MKINRVSSLVSENLGCKQVFTANFKLTRLLEHETDTHQYQSGTATRQLLEVSHLQRSNA